MASSAAVAGTAASLQISAMSCGRVQSEQRQRLAAGLADDEADAGLHLAGEVEMLALGAPRGVHGHLDATVLLD